MEKLVPPLQFSFPFTPYPIQEDFMKALYAAIEEGKLGIFESPTGTGKSLSLICGALTWLRDHEVRQRKHLETLLKVSDEVLNDKNSDTSPFSWLNEQAEQAKARHARAEAKASLDAMTTLEEKISKVRLESKKRKMDVSKKVEANKMFQHNMLKNAPLKGEVKEDHEPDDDLLLDEGCLDALKDQPDAEGEDDHKDDDFQCTKIFFCSRTHSQLAQFVSEVQRSSFVDTVRLAPLASRQHYCINNAVNKVKSISLINEKCLDLQRRSNSKTTAVSTSGEVTKKARKASSASQCMFMNRPAIELLSHDILSEVQDGEKIVKAGKDLHACPYYASRASVMYSQVVVIPYNTLLHKATREACGVAIKDNVIIIDEAHNLLESIASIHSTQVNGYQLSHAHSQLVQYRDKYQSRFSPSTLLHLNQVIFVVGKLIKILGGKAGYDPNGCIEMQSETKIFTLPDFAISAEMDNLNIFKLLAFCKASKICHKLHSFSRFYGSEVKIHKPTAKIDGVKAFLKEMKTSKDLSVKIEGKEGADSVKLDDSSDYGNNPFMVVMGFLESLTNDFTDGRILLKIGPSVGRGSLKFLLLNPAAHFQDIIRQARSVIVAGGTMEPVSEFQNQLFISAGASADRIYHFSCGHIIPPENILPIVLGSGPSGRQFDFSYTQRNSDAMVKELGRLILNMCNILPAGIVCFFPSYDYEKYVMEVLKKEGIIDQIERKKKIFREPKHSSEVEETLSAYGSCIARACKTSNLTGAIMFSVIGGKLSEGINFSDDLGRCVIVIGLPFPNIKSVELREQMNFLDMTVGNNAGRIHYENLCMKAVNQSIGRAVRHKNDYAAVLLVDHRYLQKSRQEALPAWILRSLQSHASFGPAFRDLNKFFQARRSAKTT